MNVDEVFDLAKWYRERGAGAGQLYEALHTVLKHNATQNEKQPVRDQLDTLISELEVQPLTELNLQQVAHLDKMGVAQFLGERGAAFVKHVVTQSSYDPATSATEIKTATDKVNGTIKIFQALTNSLGASSFEPDDPEIELAAGQTMARIQFRQDASIGNIAEMRKWSVDWNDIARGIAHLVGEKPNDMKVVSASKGSIIICVSGSITLISLFAFMSKKVSGILLDALKVQNAIEDLRHKKILNDTVEASLRDDQKKREKALVAEVSAELRAKAGDGFKEEHDGHLVIAVNKYFDFITKGGEVDYLQPPESEDDEEVEAGSPKEAQAQLVGELRNLISEIRTIKGEALLLEGMSDNANE